MRYAIAFTALTVLALSAPAGAQTQKSTQGKFCLTSASGVADCKYQTMAACEKAKTGRPTNACRTSMTTGAGSRRHEGEIEAAVTTADADKRRTHHRCARRWHVRNVMRRSSGDPPFGVIAQQAVGEF